MATGQKRWFVYILLGLLFGVLDWYYLDGLAHFPWGTLANNPLVVPIIIALNYGIWLVPVLRITYHESTTSHSAIRSALAGASCWTSSIVGYYVYYTVLLSFWGLPHMDHMLILGDKPAGFWQQWGSAFQKIILNQVLEWLPVAILGGSVVGLAIYWIIARRSRRKQKSQSQDNETV